VVPQEVTPRANMLRSMTGHGRGVAEVGGRRATVEIRAVNHRFFDLKLRAPWFDAAVEDLVTQAVRRRVQRGSFTVTLREEGAVASAPVRVDVMTALNVAKALDELRTSLGMSQPIPLELIASQPGVIQVGEAGDQSEQRWLGLQPAVEGALDQLISMREREGAALSKDLLERLARLEVFSLEVEKLASAAPEEWRRRLTERLGKLAAAAHAQVDEGRLYAEVAIMADRLDVTEEIVRLRSHLAQARSLLDQDDAVGRRLDFLVQELGREVNTIGSKSQSAEIARRVVEAKAELEKIREQVQNVE
jgi:uncharacterized protein (TIGR00255 family)